MIKRPLRRLRRRVSEHLPAIQAAARIISLNPPHGFKFLVQAQLAPRIESDPDVYPFAAFLAPMFDCSHVIIVGRPTAKQLLRLLPNFQIIGVVPSADVESYRKQFPFATWQAADPDLSEVSIPESVLRRAAIVCARAIDDHLNPTALLKQLKTWLTNVPVCLLTTGEGDVGNDSTDAAARGKWTLPELARLLTEHGLNASFIGLTASDNVTFDKKTILAILQKNSFPKPLETVAPPNFRVIAFMAAYNEEDIIVESIKKWTNQAVHVHLLENWSTDATYDLVKQLEGSLPVTVERFPAAGPSPYFDWGAMLKRIEDLSGQLEADWFVRRGADEIEVSPWPGVSYRDGLYLVDRSGFNCVDHAIIEFHPVDDEFQAGMDHEEYFKHFDFNRLSHHWQRKAWKNCGKPVSSLATAGHDLVFEGRRIFPFKFLAKHYSFRSQKHAEKKVFCDRKSRYDPKERARGWHIHYDSIQKGYQFLQSPAEKEVFDEEHFNKTYLVERLSSIGTDR